MNSQRAVVSAVLKGALVLVVFWISALILVQFGERVAGGWAVSELGEVLACALGVFLALRLHVKPVAYVLAGQLAFTVSELALHSIYGIACVQGGPTHFAVMLAGTLGVALGWFLRTRGTTAEPQRADVVA
ncbi:MAG TPA: hypothetical protein VGQ46_16560 [Thermoanaerobaculia bacterium]|jgi:hypothetical protein|nr:hypothetical protein [Thermoanaerobaculia bacterium]